MEVSKYIRILECVQTRDHQLKMIILIYTYISLYMNLMVTTFINQKPMLHTHKENNPNIKLPIILKWQGKRIKKKKGKKELYKQPKNN